MQKLKSLKKSIIIEVKNIDKWLGFTKRVECLAKNPAFISLRDHKKFSLVYPEVFSLLRKVNLEKEVRLY